MLDSLITSKLRIKLLTKFFINPEVKAWLRGLEGEFGVSSNAVRQELNKLEEAGVISSEFQGNKKLFTANRNHPLFDDLQRILMKTVGIDKILEQVITRLGDLESVYVTGSLAKGIDIRRLCKTIFLTDLGVIGIFRSSHMPYMLRLKNPSGLDLGQKS